MLTNAQIYKVFWLLVKFTSINPTLFLILPPLRGYFNGEVHEWLKWHAWKACVRETVPRVRIPLSPLLLAVASFSGQRPQTCEGEKYQINKSRTAKAVAGFFMRQEDFGALIGVSRQTINAIEKGKYDPSLPTAFRLAKVLEKSIEELFEFEEN